MNRVKESCSNIRESGSLPILHSGNFVVDAVILFYFIQDTFGLNGTCIEGWRPDLG